MMQCILVNKHKKKHLLPHPKGQWSFWSTTLVPFYQTKRNPDPDDRNHYAEDCENLIFHISFFCSFMLLYANYTSLLTTLLNRSFLA